MKKLTAFNFRLCYLFGSINHICEATCLYLIIIFHGAISGIVIEIWEQNILRKMKFMKFKNVFYICNEIKFKKKLNDTTK